MKWNRITVENFRGVASCTLDLATHKRAVITGPNGSGKSTMLVCAPLWALFGTKAIDGTVATQVRRGETRASVELQFSKGAREYLVTRGHPAKLTVVELNADAAPTPIASGITAGQAAIDEILGVSLQAVVAGSIIRQGESTRFTDARPTERLGILAELLGSKRWSAAREYAHERVKDIRLQLGKAAVRREHTEEVRVKWVAAEAEMLQHLSAKPTHNMVLAEDLADATTAVDDFAKETAALVAEAAALQEWTTTHAAILKQQAAAASSVDHQINALAELQRQVATLTAEKPYDKGQHDQTLLSEEECKEAIYARRALVTEFDAAEKTARCLSKRPNMCRMDECGLIAHALTARKQASRQRLLLENMAVEKEMFASLKEIRVARDSHQAAKVVAEKLVSLTASRDGATLVLDGHAAALVVIDAAVHRAPTKPPAPSTTMSELLAKRDVLQAVVDSTRKAVRDQAEEQRTWSTRRDWLDKRITELESDMFEYDASATTRLVKSLDLWTHTEDFTKAAPHLLVASRVGTIEAIANEVLADVMPGMRLEIRHQRETQSGTTRDEIDLVGIQGVHEVPISTLSGGERFRMDLAIRLGIATAAGLESETLIIDEGWGSQDAHSVEAIKDALRKLSHRFPRLFTISHRDDVADLFDCVINITDIMEPTNG